MITFINPLFTLGAPLFARSSSGLASHFYQSLRQIMTFLLIFFFSSLYKKVKMLACQDYRGKLLPKSKKRKFHSRRNRQVHSEENLVSPKSVFLRNPQVEFSLSRQSCSTIRQDEFSQSFPSQKLSKVPLTAIFTTGGEMYYYDINLFVFEVLHIIDEDHAHDVPNVDLQHALVRLVKFAVNQKPVMCYADDVV